MLTQIKGIILGCIRITMACQTAYFDKLDSLYLYWSYIFKNEEDICNQMQDT